MSLLNNIIDRCEKPATYSSSSTISTLPVPVNELIQSHRQNEERSDCMTGADEDLCSQQHNQKPDEQKQTVKWFKNRNDTLIVQILKNKLKLSFSSGSVTTDNNLIEQKRCSYESMVVNSDDDKQDNLMFIDERKTNSPQSKSKKVFYYSKKRKSPLSSLTFHQLFQSILLPFIILFLLPTLKLENKQNLVKSINHSSQQDYYSYSFNQLQHQTVLSRTLKEILIPMITFPFDRLRFVSFGLIGQVSSKEINSKHDLQEEETHLQMLAPAEHRAANNNYHAHHHPLSQVNNNYNNQQGINSIGIRSPDYAGNQVDQAEGVGSVESGEPTGALMANSAGNANNALESRSDLPYVKALNVKCEKNHMTVSTTFFIRKSLIFYLNQLFS